ncbi:MAG TPA: hypothetical protein VE631_08365, partial [Alphaproteobacteria bacterium]|nr:hypothetical protein [Alphaproteobacteria bacterium]
PMPLPTVMVRRAVLQDVGTFDTRLPACEDWELLLRIARRYSFDYIDGIAMLCDGAGGDRMSARARSVFIANHMIFRQYNRHSPSRATLAAYLALQSRELLHLSKYDLAGRYARASLRLSPDREERLALRTVRELMMRRPLGRVLVQAYARRHALSWRPSL